jgi:hypothetical protein
MVVPCHHGNVEVFIEFEIVRANFTRRIVNLKKARRLLVVVSALAANLRKRSFDFCNLCVGRLFWLIGQSGCASKGECENDYR